VTRDNESMSVKEQAVRTVLAGGAAGIINSLLSGDFWTVGMLWDIAFWTVLFGILPPVYDLLLRRRRAKRL
jgi:hypothetical protein